MNSTRRMFMKMMGIGTASLVLPSCMYARRDSRHNSKPNVIFILTDDHRFDAMGFMGHPFLETPHMDRMAREGVHLANAFVTHNKSVLAKPGVYSYGLIRSQSRGH